MIASELKKLNPANITPSLIGDEFPTRFGPDDPAEWGGRVTITDYNAEHNAYRSTSGLWWTLEDGAMIGYDGVVVTNTETITN